MRSNEIRLRKLILRMGNNVTLTTRPSALSFGSNYFNYLWLFGAVESWILSVMLMSIKEGNLNTILVVVKSSVLGNVRESHNFKC